MATVWLTYAWDDNKQGDVDFIAQTLEQFGVTIKLDRWNIEAGKRLWVQISAFITDPSESDAWLLYATINSLQSERCKEEFAIALNRALESRGGSFPVLALFPSPVDAGLIPPSIKIRLHVSITDSDWKEQIKAAAEGRPHTATKTNVQPYHFHVHSNQPRPKPFAIEVRPRAGVWAPFIAAIPFAEKPSVNPRIMIGPRDVPKSTGILFRIGPAGEHRGNLWIMTAENQSTPTESYYIWCDALPTSLTFGVNGGVQYTIVLALGQGRRTDSDEASS